MAHGFAVNSPQFLLQRDHDFHHDRATIGSRSGHDRGLIVILGLRRSRSNLVHAIPRRKLPDRGSIEPRSWSSSMNRLDRPMELQEIGRSDRDRKVSAVDEDPALLVSPRGVR